MILLLNSINLGWFLIDILSIFYVTVAVRIHITIILELAGLQMSKGFDIFHRSDWGWLTCVKTLNQSLNFELINLYLWKLSLAFLAVAESAI